jgi:hypothetical protein
MRPAEAVHGPPHRRRAQVLPLVLGPPGTVLQHRGIRHRFQPRAQERLVLAADRARAARHRRARA